MDRLLRLGLWAGIFLCCATAASAVDGVIEINQAAVGAGGITPGDAPGFPASLNVEGSYRLTGNLDVRNEATPENVTAIEVLGTTVTIDLNGFTILGPAQCSGNPPTTDITCTGTGMGKGIQRLGNARLTVRNGTIRGMGAEAIDTAGSALVENLYALGNGTAGIRVSSNSIVRNCIVTENGGTGIELATGSIAAGNVANLNGGSGISANGTSLTATNNATSQNFGAGINTGPRSTVIGNTTSDNLSFGLALGADSGYTHNVINSNLGGTVSGGVEMPPNVCGGDLICP